MEAEILELKEYNRVKSEIYSNPEKFFPVAVWIEKHGRKNIWYEMRYEIVGRDANSRPQPIPARFVTRLHKIADELVPSEKTQFTFYKFENKFACTNSSGSVQCSDLNIILKIFERWNEMFFAMKL